MTLLSLPASGGTAQGTIDGPVGLIECVVAAPSGVPRGVAVVCHPHPLMGGALSNKVTYTLASVALKHGLAVARFNFRGVGRSQGEHDHGVGEAEDCAAVAAWMRARLPGAPLLLGGFSFGAFVSLAACASARPAALISIALPFGRYFNGAPNPPHPGCPWLAMHSRDDEVVAYDDTAGLLAGYQPPPEWVTVDGAGHFFHGRLQDIQNAALPYLAQHWPLPARP